jgi:hypothetical protein
MMRCGAQNVPASTFHPQSQVPRSTQSIDFQKYLIPGGSRLPEVQVIDQTAGVLSDLFQYPIGHCQFLMH